MPAEKDPVLHDMFRGAKWNGKPKMEQSKTVCWGCITGFIHLSLYDIEQLLLLMGLKADLLKVIPPAMFKNKVVVFHCSKDMKKVICCQ